MAQKNLIVFQKATIEALQARLQEHGLSPEVDLGTISPQTVSTTESSHADEGLNGVVESFNRLVVSALSLFPVDLALITI